ncbi:MAG: lysylphosphatidylglycerol synthase transmembrane domain-containing protein [Bacillota bacterium]|jgi:uncharacterized protein (TIRG00374 family)
MRFNWRRGLGLSLTLSIVVAIVLVWKTFDDHTIANLGLFEPRFLVLALLMLLVAVGIEGQRIRLVARAMGVAFGWARGCLIFLSTMFASLVTPMGMGELPALTYLYNKAGLNLGASLAAAIVRNFVTKLVFLAGIIWLFGLARGRVQFGPVTGDLFTVVALVFAATTVLTATYVLFPRLLQGLFAKLPRRWQQGFFGKWQQRLELEAREFDKGLKIMWGRGPLSLVRIALLSLVYWLVWFGILPVLARGLGVGADPAQLISRQFALTLALPFIPVPGASGALELAMAGVYQGVIPRGVLGIFVLSWRLVTYYLPLLIGALAALGSLWGSGGNRQE